MLTCQGKGLTCVSGFTVVRAVIKGQYLAKTASYLPILSRLLWFHFTVTVEEKACPCSCCNFFLHQIATTNNNQKTW